MVRLRSRSLRRLRTTNVLQRSQCEPLKLLRLHVLRNRCEDWGGEVRNASSARSNSKNRRMENSDISAEAFSSGAMDGDELHVGTISWHYGTVPARPVGISTTPRNGDVRRHVSSRHPKAAVDKLRDCRTTKYAAKTKGGISTINPRRIQHRNEHTSLGGLVQESSYLLLAPATTPRNF